MTQLLYHCKICKAQGMANYNPDCPIQDLEKWRVNICCARCYTFYDSYQKLKRQIARVCYALVNIKRITDYKVKRDWEVKCCDILTKTTKRVATLCCDYYKLADVWSEDFVEQLREQPDKCYVILKAYHAGVRRLAK